MRPHILRHRKSPGSSLTHKMIISLSLVYLLPSLTAHAQWFKDEQAIMGTRITVELWLNDAQAAQQCINKVMAEMRRIDRTMSPFRKDSELSRVNRDAAHKAVTISQELFDLIKRSIAVSKLSQGAFDITFASVGEKYNYRRKIKPTDSEITQGLKHIDYRHLLLDDKHHSIRFASPGVKIDLGGIAKGYAVDNSIAILQQCGVQQAMVSAGGDSRLLGDKRGRPWMTGIRDPRSEQGSILVIPLSNTAISTSGDYERYFIQDGVRYHHILSPKTGKPVHSTRSTTVIGPDATTTDALSTALFILGPQRGLKLAESLADIEAVIIDAKGRIHYSSGLMPPAKSGSSLGACK